MRTKLVEKVYRTFLPFDPEGYEIVQVDGGDMGRAGPTGRALKPVMGFLLDRRSGKDRRKP